MDVIQKLRNVDQNIVEYILEDNKHVSIKKQNPTE